MSTEINTLRDLIDRMAEEHPKASFLINPEGGRTVTFSELREGSRLLAARFLRAGWEKGDKIAFLLDNGLFTAQLFLGTMYGGFVSVPLNVRAGVSQLAYTLDHSDAKVVFVGEAHAAMLKEIMAHVRRSVEVVSIGAEGWPAVGEAPVPGENLGQLTAEDAALLMYTSGSTGQPKAAVHTHASVLAHARNSMLSHQLTAADRSLLVLPLYHINAECVTLLPTLLSGGSLVVPDHFAVSQFWDWIEDYACTWSALVPTIISQLLDWKDPKAHSRQAAFARIRFLRSSSAPLSPALHREFLDKFKLPLIQAMGCTEAGNVFSNPVPPGENKIGSPGLPWGFEARIVNREGADLPVGEPGEVLIRGPAMMREYYKDPAATVAALDADRWLHTGDLAYRDKDGYFFVIGRSKELIIKGGMNIAPKQIDEVLESHPAVSEAAVVGVPDRYVGEDLIAFVVLRAEMTCQEKDLLAFCEARLGHFKTPTRIHFVQDLPKGPSGKVQRRRLVEEASRPAFAQSPSLGVGVASDRANASPAQAGAGPSVASIEQIIAGVWGDLLGQANVSREDNFFALGGHSLLAIQSLSRLRDKLPVVLSLSDFFENATVAELAAQVQQRILSAPPQQSAAAGRTTADTQAIPPRDRTLPCPLSPAQQRIWFFEQLVPGVPLYNESEAVRLEGELNVEAMEKALNVIITRHEILRSTIQLIDGQPVVKAHESWPLQLKKIDLSGLDASKRQAQVERLLIEEPQLPYHLEAEPGIRATLIRLGPREHVFILMMHHLVCDWSSEGVLWREMSAGYRAFSRSEQMALAPLPIQHGDYAAWQNQQLPETSFAEDLNFWVQNLAGAPALLELPTDRPRPAAISYRGARLRFQLDAALVPVLRDLSRREKVSLFTVFAAALDVLLHRYTGQDDILVGIPLADRERPELQSMIGFLLHTHVLRTRLSGDMTFRQLLAPVQKGVLDLYTHSAVPFDQVVSKLQPERNLSYSPLFQVMLNWRDRDQLLSVIGMDGLRVESLLAESRTSKFDLTFMLTDGGDDIWLEMEYNTDLFEDARIRRMVQHYQSLLDAVAADPNTQLAELPMLRDAEREQLLVDWNRTEVEYSQTQCLHELVEEQVKRTPDAVAAIFGTQEITYAQLDRQATMMASLLQKEGAGPGSFVALCSERNLDLVVAVLAVLKSGAAYVPIDPNYPRERIAFYLEDSQAVLLLTQRKVAETLPAHRARTICLDDLGKGGNGTSLKCAAKRDDVAYLIYTSGSTGKPKGVAIEHRNAVNFVRWALEAFTHSEMAGVLASTSVCFDLSIYELFVTLSRGGKLILAENALQLPHLPAKNQVTLINTVPSAMAELVRAGAVPPGIQTVNLAGEALATSLVDQIYALPHIKKVYDLYGPTETTTYSSWTLRRKGELPTVGRPIANTQIYIVDQKMQPVPIGVPGELLIGGEGVARGYLHREELTAQKFIQNPFRQEKGARLYRTGDLARYRADGNIEYFGRVDQQVKFRGFRIELGEIESVLKMHPAVDAAVVVAREDTAGNKQLVAYIVSKNGDLPTAELRDLLKAKLPIYMTPSAFVPLKSLPLTPNGKVDRKALPKPTFESVAETFVVPSTPTEVALAEIWRTVLGLKQVGLNDNFFEVGGHSLLAIRLAGEIKRKMNADLPVREIFQHPTLGGLAAVLAAQDYGERRSRFIKLQEGRPGPELVFLIDDGSLGLLKLGRAIGQPYPAYASVSLLQEATLRASEKMDVSSLPTLKQLASDHVALIRSRQTSSPLILVGHCFGGVLAFEVAHQLVSAGQKVEAVLLLDTWMKRPSVWWQRKSWLQTHLKQLWQEGPRYLWNKGRKRVNLEKERLAARLQLAIRDDFSMHVPWPIIYRIYRHAAVGYQPKVLASRGCLFVSEGDWASGAYRKIDNYLGAGDLFSDGIEVFDAPGDHVTVLDESHLPELAQCVRGVLARLRSRESGQVRSVPKQDEMAPAK